ncbi:SHOCT domain-containing protein [Halosimplex litoreum]|uniref:SHOCT domain-containing protein n=1 Tax=Halosimplex litoreum TaxID=1198301 RepID=A0A7T3FV98_9EURY|nr:SHOCT domain-containing protein [Halosimplex litoreum]QPV61381.1 SHOCT domain-containing protein [Halosimplex litoreum]
MREALRSIRTVTRRFVALLPVLIAVSTLPTVLLVLFNGGVVTALEVAIAGWLLATPVTALLVWVVLNLSPVDLPGSLGERTVDLPSVLDGREASGNRPDGDDPVETLRERFARGEIDQTEFERRLDALLAAEDGAGERASEGPSDSAVRPPAARQGSHAQSRTDDRPQAPGRDREPEST